jgi:uncharacterized protein (DUF58 family)
MGEVAATVSRVFRRRDPSRLSPREVWRRLRAWRRIRFTGGGGVFTAGAFAVGFAAINTGNNLLYLLLGAMLGFIVVSGWLSEQVLRKLTVHRLVPRGVTVGHPVRIDYQVTNGKTRLPSLALELTEQGLPGRAFLPVVLPGATARGRAENRFVGRGVYPLQAVTVSTAFPFGLFMKSRDLPLGGELVIWPRADRNAGDLPRTGAETGGIRLDVGPPGPAGHRGEYRGLRGYRPGDDPRDIHWRSTARLGDPVVREYERSEGETVWVVLDTRGTPGEGAEIAVERAASLAARAYRQGRRFGFAAPGFLVDPGQGTGQLERVLDALARVDFRPHAPPPTSPAPPERCVLVSPAQGKDRGEAP